MPTTSQYVAQPDIANGRFACRVMDVHKTSTVYFDPSKTNYL